MSENNNIKNKTISGLFWKFLERCGTQGVSFIVSIILARILAPEIYGTISLVMIFINIFQVFSDSGIGSALVQKKDADQLDYSSVFFFNILLCTVIYGILFFTAPFIASFYNNPELTPVIRVLGIVIIISSLRNVQYAYMLKNMQFRKYFVASLGGIITGASMGLVLAYTGNGVWALVGQQLTTAFITTVILWIIVKWKPSFKISFNRIGSLFGYGWKLLTSSLLNTIYLDLRSLIIGKWYSSEDLAFYSKGQSFPSLIVTNINSSIDSVLFPAMSLSQDSKETVKNMTRRAIKTSSYIIWPLMMGLAIVAEPLIKLLLTDTWLPAAPFLQLACISFALEPLQTANLNAIKAMGRSDIFFKLEIIKKTIAVAILLISMRFGVFAIAASGVLYSIIATMINSFPNKSLLSYSYLEQLKDIAPSMLLSVAMAAMVYPIVLIGLHPVLTLLIQVSLGAVIYLLGSIIFRLEAFKYILKLVKSRKGG